MNFFPTNLAKYIWRDSLKLILLLNLVIKLIREHMTPAT